jgi:hypothetical protein
MRSTIVPKSLADEIAAGDALKLREIAERFQVDPSVVFRWMQHGLPDGKGKRVRLAAIRRGKCWLTSEAAVKRFFSALPHSHDLPVNAPAAMEIIVASTAPSPGAIPQSESPGIKS